MQRFMLSDSSGQKSISFTMMLIGFITITIWLVASIFENIAGIAIREFDSTGAMSYFTPLAMLYFGRRYVGASKLTNKKKPVTHKDEDSTE